jgi:hypothetical protein
MFLVAMSILCVYGLSILGSCFVYENWPGYWVLSASKQGSACENRAPGLKVWIEAAPHAYPGQKEPYELASEARPTVLVARVMRSLRPLPSPSRFWSLEENMAISL